MKYLFAIIFLFIIFVSCQTTDKKGSQSNKLIEKFKPFLHGTWIPADYINDIEKTKSPLESSDKIGFVSEFSIDTTGISEDSIHIGAAFGNHEGGDFVLYFKQGQSPGSLLTSLNDGEDSYDLGYVINLSDTFLIIYRYDKTKGLRERTLYLKVQANNHNNDLGNAFQQMVNKKLAAGTYIVLDSTGNETRVELTIDGKITAFSDFKAYYIITDFVASPENITDEICFELQTVKQKCYGFRIIADTINLFEPAKDEQDKLFKPGPTIYKFVRQN